MQEQFAGMANLMAHPLAGMAAASALGFGMASHAFGMWMGAIVGAAEASQRLVDDKPQTAPVVRKPAGLKLVSSQPVAKPSAKPVRKTLARADDLKVISGIGPKLEQVLNARGISSYAQVAALNAAEIAKLDDELGFGGRILRDDWVGQAKSLASGPKSGSKGADRKRS
ncbi:MAG: hypothetical protein ABW191_04165 [Aliihoeflea sp.]